MTTRGMRATCGVSAAVVLTVIAAACSGGGSHVSVRPQTTRSSTTSEVTTLSKPSAKSAVSKKHKRKHKGATVAPSSPSFGITPNASATVTVPLVTAAGNTTPSTAAPTTTAAPTRTTSAPTTTVYAGPKPYDPSKPIDLGGEPGVTPAEQKRAEQLVRDTLRDLPKYADWHVAFAAGYRSIGDGFTGDEHFVNWSYLNDGHILDSKYPEALVYEMRNGKKTLVAAMYSLNLGSTFADVPDVGGPLTQWHVHNDLCLADDPSDPLRKVVSSLTTVNGTCPPGTSKAGSAPMLHVWIVKNACGPFAALEGIGAGQVPPGETRNCDTGHGSS